MTAAPALPISICPRDGESIESWLEHLADANGLTTAQLLSHLRSRGASTRYLTLAPAPNTVRALAALARISEQTVTATTLGAFDGTALDLTGLDPGDRYSYRQVAARGWAPAHGTQICPICLAEDGAWRTTWRLLIVTACTRHRTLLVARCPTCRRPFRDQRHSHLRRVGARDLCGNPLGAGPTRQCQHDLTTIPVEHADVPFQTSWQTGYEGMIGVTMKEMSRGTTTCDPGGAEDSYRAQRSGWRGLDRRGGAQGEGVRAVDRPLEG